MAEPFLSELRLFSFGFPPKGWALCNGQLLPINQNQGLFSLLGTTFGGDGRVNFALPDLRARAPIGSWSAYSLGERMGEEAHTLSISEIPTHTHLVNASTQAGDTPAPGGNLFASASNLYRAPSDLVALNAASVTNVGGSQAHTNLPPFLVLNWCVALQGIFPSPS